jgi:hypothetical protein
MTRAEFIERSKSAESVSRWPTYVFTLVLILGCIFWSSITDQINQLGVAWLTELFNHPWAIVLIYFMAYGFILHWITTWRCRGADLVCANCATPLTAHLASIAIATGNCGKCGQPAFEVKNSRDLFD